MLGICIYLFVSALFPYALKVGSIFLKEEKKEKYGTSKESNTEMQMQGSHTSAEGLGWAHI